MDARPHIYQLTANGNRANCKLKVDPTGASGMTRGIERKITTPTKTPALFFWCVLNTFRESETVGQYVLETNLQNNNYVVTDVLLD